MSLDKILISIFGLAGMAFIYWFFLFTGNVFAQSNPDELAKKYGITFPIAELGNCESYQTCKAYCDKPTSANACISFAKAKGFYKEESVSIRVPVDLSVAQKELGCSSASSCREFCDKRDNWLVCKKFAEKYGLTSQGTAFTSKKDVEVLEEAKKELGCNSPDQCWAYCEKEESFRKCAEFAQKKGLEGGDDEAFEVMKPAMKAKLGCDSIESCTAVCNNPINLPKCMEFAKQMGFEGDDAGAGEPPEVWCPKISAECKWDGSVCMCSGPGTCAQTPGYRWNGQYCMSESTPDSGSTSGSDWCPKIGPYCAWDGSTCTCWDECVNAGGKWDGKHCEYPTTIQDAPVGSDCNSQPGCKWTGTTCECTTTGTEDPPEVWCPKAGTYCKWTGTSCDCSEPGEIWCPREGCMWSGSECRCDTNTTPSSTNSQVQGTTSRGGILETIWDSIRSFLAGS